VRTAAPFVITVPPAVTSATPQKGSIGSELTIKGSGFGQNSAVIKVTLAGQLLEVQSVRDDQVIARVPPGAKTGRIKVEIPLQGIAEPNLEFEVVPTTAPAPAVAPVAPAATKPH
jgi:hypothetical protein